MPINWPGWTIGANSYADLEPLVQYIDNGMEYVSSLWYVVRKELEVSDITAGATAWVTGNIAEEGYTPVGFVGWYCSGGTGNSLLYPYSLAINSNDGSPSIALRNCGSSTATGVTLQVDVLYFKAD